MVQADPMEHALKAPGSERLKLKCHKMLSSFAFNYFNLHRYDQGSSWLGPLITSVIVQETVGCAS
jgi:hypothetical protein